MLYYIQRHDITQHDIVYVRYTVVSMVVHTERVSSLSISIRQGLQLIQDYQLRQNQPFIFK